MAAAGSGRQTASTRAKDSDRNDTCKVLDSALADGQLSGEEHRQRVSAATHAATLGELRSLVTDLQTENAPVQLPDLHSARRLRPGGGWGIKAAIAGVLVVLGIGIGWGLYGNSSSPLDFTSDPGAKDDGIAPVVLTPPRQLDSLNGINGLLNQMRKKFGDTNGYDLTVRPERASLERPDPNDARLKLYYSYQGGWGDPTSPSAKSDDDKLVDLSNFDVPAVVGVWRGAAATLGIDPADVDDTYLIIEATDDITAPPGTLELSIYVNSKFNTGSGRIELNPDGSAKEIYRS